MAEDIGNIITWVFCGGIPVAVLGTMLFFLLRALWITIRGRRRRA
jgi:hypothetical protein